MGQEIDLRSVLLVTKYTRLEQYVDQHSQAGLHSLEAFEEATHNPDAWTREFTLELLAQRGIENPEKIPAYYISKFHEHYSGMAHLLNALEQYEDDIEDLNILPFKDYLKLYADNDLTVKNHTLAIIAAGDETFKTVAFDLAEQPCIGIGVKTAQSSKGWFSSCDAEEFGERLEDMLTGNYSIEPYYTVDVEYNGRALEARTMAEVCIEHSEENWIANRTFSLQDKKYFAKHWSSSGLIVAPLQCTEPWIETEVHNIDSYKRELKAITNYARYSGKPLLAWCVRAPKNRRERQYGFTDKLEVTVLSPATLLIGKEERITLDTFESEQKLVFTPSEEPINIIRFDDYDI